MEIFILENAYFDSASTWSSTTEEDREDEDREDEDREDEDREDEDREGEDLEEEEIVFAINKRPMDHQYRLTIGKANAIGETYLRNLISASEESASDIILRLKTDAAAKSNKVTVQLEGFFTEEKNKVLWDVGSAMIHLRVSISMTKYTPTGNKIQVLERGFINSGLMKITSPQLTGVDFPSSILETCYSDGSAEKHRHFYLNGTLMISLTSDCHLPCQGDRRNFISKKIFLEQIHADVKTVCKDGVLQAHKAFLAAQSPVFAAMFRSGTNMKEAQTNEIEIEDMTMDALSALVSFLYDETICQGIHKNPKLAIDLLIGSNKYLISKLELRMSTIISSKPVDWCDLESALKLYTHTRNLDSFSDLKMKSVQFMKSKSGEIPQSEEFRELFTDEKKHKIGLELFALGFSCNSSVAAGTTQGAASKK